MEFSEALTRSQIIKKLKPGQNLLAVSKLQPVKKIKALHEQGQIDFAENYVQEALLKIEELKSLPLRWHLIGPLQKNKIKFLQKNFHYIHSVDSLELAQKISENAIALQHCQKIFLQVNLAEEDSKAGFSEKTLAIHWPELKKLSGIEIVGLMAMPPIIVKQAEENRTFFKKLKKLGSQLNLNEFSMGTSQDYKVALEEGATWIRLGTILFGERIKK